MIYLLIFTCLCVLGICVWIVKNEKPKILVKPQFDSHIDDMIFKLITEAIINLDGVEARNISEDGAIKSQKLARKKKRK